jgi:hypothetical protein
MRLLYIKLAYHQLLLGANELRPSDTKRPGTKFL